VLKEETDKTMIKGTCTSGVKDICQRYMGNAVGNELSLTGKGNGGYQYY
jgi:hypothetical protein